MKAIYYIISVCSTIGLCAEFGEGYLLAEIAVKTILIIMFVVSIDKLGLFKK